MERETNVKEFAEQNFVEAPAKVSECFCEDEHRLHVALSEQRSTRLAKIFMPDHKGLENARCLTFGRCR
ncbi:MAG: hypothetical protein HY913_10320 [Desulfomonile tiedjei]|nr:hypothetical protein [Desulfomonile tiedjei]